MYKIGNKIINILNMTEDQFLSRLIPFSIIEDVETKDIDVMYKVEYHDILDLPLKKDIIYVDKNLVVAKRENSLCYYHTCNNVPHSMTEEFSKSKYAIHLLKEFKKYALENEVNPYFFPDLMHIDRALIEDGFFVLHSSYIEVDGNAILFTAPSGGGKSTQAELWKKYKGARIINGDKSIIGKKNNEWYVYGIPFSGSSEYCLNESYPLKAVVVLAKGLDNELVEIGMRGFQSLLSQSIFSRWDKEFCNILMDNVMALCSEIPVYYYSCTKEHEAVDVLYRNLVEKGALDGIFK